jgi:DNA-directed RNA polymerase subunit M/transcription elongation factor TFIIS
MLYPSQDREIKRLIFRCRNCGQSEEVEENCIYVNELVKDTRYEVDTCCVHTMTNLLLTFYP